ncbi:MAG: oxidoreductase [Nitriliruptorales bacterium]|nr:oxidoreductase [Nitriliruptorales bacterium]
MAEHWTEQDAPDQSGRVCVITGANSGLGLVTARKIASRGATVVMACRNLAKAEAAAGEVRAAADDDDRVEILELDLSSLDSIRAASTELIDRHPRLDVLINNAGVMMTPHTRTADGFELQLGTNHLGHFALTGLVLPALLDVTGSRIVTVSSGGHRAGRIDFDNLQLEHGYGRFRAYAQSKLANLLFAFQLDRRLRAAGAETRSLAAHPGMTATELGQNLWWWTKPFQPLVTPLISQDAETGALPQVRAALDPDATGGEYYGPSGFQELFGPPVRVGARRLAHDPNVQRRLWEASEQLTGVQYGI